MEQDREEPALPLRATGIFLGLWITALLVLAFFVVPLVFASCLPGGAPSPSPSP